MKFEEFQALSITQKQRLCSYCDTHGICVPATDRTKEIGNGCYSSFDEGSSIWCSQWKQLDMFKVCLITRSKNESKRYN